MQFKRYILQSAQWQSLKKTQYMYYALLKHISFSTDIMEKTGSCKQNQSFGIRSCLLLKNQKTTLQIHSRTILSFPSVISRISCDDSSPFSICFCTSFPSSIVNVVCNKIIRLSSYLRNWIYNKLFTLFPTNTICTTSCVSSRLVANSRFPLGQVVGTVQEEYWYY